MQNIIHSLTTSDYIQILSIIATFFTGIVAIFISIKSLRQNSLMIEASTRPYISLSATTMNGFPVLILKNYGSSATVITYFKSSIDLAQCGFGSKHKPFSNMVGTYLGPNQAISAMFRDGSLAVNFIIDIRYSYLDKEYSASFPVNILSLQECLMMKRKVNKETELSVIAETLQDIEPHIIELK